MSFKLFSCAVLVSLILGCAKESEPMRKPFTVNFGANSTCFKNIPETFQSYFNSELSDSQINSFWACADSALQKINIVFGQDDQTMTPQEVNRFLMVNFLGGEYLPVGLMNSLMDIKVAWFGGTNTALSKAELARLRVWFSEFNKVMVMLRPYVAIYTGDKENIEYEEMLNAEIYLTSAAHKIGALPLAQGKALKTEDLKRFLNELEQYLSKGAEFSPMQKWVNLLPLVVTLKKLMFGTPEEVIAVTDWKNLMSIGAQGFMILNSTDYGVIRANIEGTIWVKNVEHIFSQLNNVISPVFDRRDGRPIVEAEWKNLFDQVEKSQLVSLKSAQLMQIYLTVHPLIKASTTKNSDFHKEDFINLLNEVAVWKNTHNKILANKALDPAQAFEAFLMDLEVKNQELQLDENAEWVMPVADKKLSIRSRLHITWRAFLIDKLLKMYGKPEGWTLDQLKPLQKGLSSLFEEKYLTKVFREANLFTLAADGDEILSPSETLQYLSLVLSGMRSSARIQTYSKDLSVENIQQAIWKNKDPIFAHLPLLSSYLKDEVTWIQANQLLMATVKDQGSLTTPWTSWELSQSQILLLYLEGFMRRFDLDHNQIIDHSEALVAFKIFAPILGQLLSKIGVGPSELEGFFLFLINYGDTPFTLYGGDILYTHWKWNPQVWTKIQADRKTLLSILATLSKL